MIYYTMQQAKRDFEMGYLTKYSIEKTQLNINAWRIILSQGNTLGVLVDARSKEQRYFKTLDGAVSTLEDIGFRVLALS